MAKYAPAFQFYPGDFIAGTLHLDAECIGCYVLLLCRQWLDGSVPNDPKKMALICKKTTQDFMPVWDEIKDKFVANSEGQLINQRLQDVRQQQLELSEKRSLAGSSKTPTKRKQKPNKGSKKIEDGSPKLPTENMDAIFDAWWGIVPNKIKRGAARAAYEKAAKLLADRGVESPHAYLTERMTRFAQSDKAKGEYCPYPSTWLNQEQYDDDPATWQRGSPRNNSDPRGNLALRDKLLAEMETQ